MKVLLLTSSCTVDEEVKLLGFSKCGLQNAIIAFQRNMQLGIQEVIEGDCDVINYYPIGAYPNYCSKLFFRGFTINKNKTYYKQLWIVNIPVVKQILTALQARKAILKWIKTNEEEEKIIIMYDLLRPYLKTISKLQTNNQLKTCTIVADLPNEFGYNISKQTLKGILLKHLGNNSLELCKTINYYGLLTKQMRTPLAITGGNDVIIEGFSNEKRYCAELQNTTKRIILYTGAIYSIYGLNILVEAFLRTTSNNYELWLCGVGDYVETLKLKASLDPRIKYLGYKTQSEIGLLQAQASVLVNPRQNIGEYTKYSFPSKIIEYLSTGRPIIAYKLDGIPDEYYDYLISPLDNSIDALTKTIINTCELPFSERKRIGEAGRNFIIERTNPRKQMFKILNLMTKK